MGTEQIGKFREANDYFDDYVKLNALFEEEGYLFFRNVLDLNQVLQVKHDFIRVLKDQGIVKNDQLEPVWSGAEMDQVDDNALYTLDSPGDLIASPELQQVIDKAFGEPALIYRVPNIRYALPNANNYISPPHQDHFYIQESNIFRTLWIPLMDIDENAGVLAIASRSHKQGVREHIEQDDIFSYILKGRKQKGISLNKIQETLLTTNYHPGDLLLFHSETIHCSLPNHSDKIRFSIDTSCQPKSAPRLWQLAKTIPELRKYRKEMKQIAKNVDINEKEFEVLITEMMRRGFPAERVHFTTVLNELNSKSA